MMSLLNSSWGCCMIFYFNIFTIDSICLSLLGKDVLHVTELIEKKAQYFLPHLPVCAIIPFYFRKYLHESL